MTVCHVRKYDFACTATSHLGRAGWRYQTGACWINSQLAFLLLPDPKHPAYTSFSSTPLSSLHQPLLSLLYTPLLSTLPLLSSPPPSLHLPHLYTSLISTPPSALTTRGESGYGRRISIGVLICLSLAISANSWLMVSRRMASYTPPSRSVTSARLASLGHSFNGACVTLSIGLSAYAVAALHRNIGVVFDDLVARCAGVV